MKRPSIPIRKLVVFAALSVADFTLTWFLISRNDGQVYEANPVAAWWLSRHGWLGLAIFKALLAGFAGLLCLAVWHHRPKVGRRVLNFACATVGAVVVYSGVLAYRAEAHPKAPAEMELSKTNDQLQYALQTSNTYREVLTEVSAELVAGNCTLAEAVDRLWETDKSSELAWRLTLRRLYELDDRSCVAANLVQFSLQDRFHDTKLVDRLRQDLIDYSGHDLMSEGRQLRSIALRAEASRSASIQGEPALP